MVKTEDKTVRLILGVLLILISLPLLGMGGMMGSFGYGMMGGLGYGFFWPMMLLTNLIGLGLLGLGIYLIYNSVN